MDSSKLNRNIFSKDSPIDLYLHFVTQHLSGEVHDIENSSLNETLKGFLKARYFHRQKNYEIAFKILSILKYKTSSDFERGEFYFLMGMNLYSTDSTAEARKCFEKSFQYILKEGYLKKAMMAKFNIIQCYVTQGMIEEAEKTESELFLWAEENNIESVLGLLSRSNGYSSLRRREFEKASLLFKKSYLYLKKEGNLSDAYLSYLYFVVTELGQGRGFNLGPSLKKILANPINDRTRHFAEYLDSIISGNDYELIKDHYQKCDREQKASIETCIPMFGESSRAKSKNTLSNRLILTLKEHGPLDKNSCIRQIWRIDEIEPSHVVRFHTLVSRINKKRKMITMTSAKEYCLN